MLAEGRSVGRRTLDHGIHLVRWCTDSKQGKHRRNNNLPYDWLTKQRFLRPTFYAIATFYQEVHVIRCRKVSDDVVHQKRGRK